MPTPAGMQGDITRFALHAILSLQSVMPLPIDLERCANRRIDRVDQ